MTAQPLGTILADVLEGLARDVRATAEASAGMKMAERGCALDAELPRQRQRELLAEEEDAGERKSAGDLGAPAKLVGSAEPADCRSALRQRGSKCEPTRYVGSHLMLVVDNARGH